LVTGDEWDPGDGAGSVGKPMVTGSSSSRSSTYK